MGVERRVHPRKLLGEDMYCYIDGARLDAASLDVSAGGMFLTTPQDVPVGATVALVFKLHDRENSSPVYLIGRVARKQKTPFKGLGLVWEKATAEDGEHLHGFVKSVLGIETGTAVEETHGPGDRPMSVFRFDPAALEDTAELEDEPAEQAVPDSTRLDAETSPKPGPMTIRMQADDIRVPAATPGAMKVGSQAVPVTVTSLGPDSAFVRTDLAPVSGSAAVQLEISVKTKHGPKAVVFRCRVKAIDEGAATGTPGIELEFASVDEGEHEGILQRYLRWLHFRSLTKSEKSPIGR